MGQGGGAVRLITEAELEALLDALEEAAEANAIGREGDVWGDVTRERILEAFSTLASRAAFYGVPGTGWTITQSGAATYPDDEPDDPSDLTRWIVQELHGGVPDPVVFDQPSDGKKYCEGLALAIKPPASVEEINERLVRLRLRRVVENDGDAWNLTEGAMLAINAQKTTWD